MLFFVIQLSNLLVPKRFVDPFKNVSIRLFKSSFKQDSSILPRRNSPANTKSKMNTLNNSVRLTGFLGSAPEVNVTKSEKKFTKINLATNSYRRNAKGEKVTETTWHQIVLWEKQAELAERYLDKGSKISIEGRLSNRYYTDQDGIKRYVTEVIVNEMDFSSKNSQI